jgi:2-amino-4-hydroxy-6-hydroxymethyldihydropteridine diphosphokinase
LAVSALYETVPVGVSDQPLFLNAACRAETEMAPHALLERVKGIEWAAGRRPGGSIWGPRPLDIDILLYGDEIVDLPDLHIPHIRLGERAFVLAPLADLAPDLAVPGLNETVRSLLQSVVAEGVRRVAEPGWELGGRITGL